MSSFTYDAPYTCMDCTQTVAPVSQQLEHSNFSSQEALSGHYKDLYNSQHGPMNLGRSHFTTFEKDCFTATAHDVYDVDATCTSRDAPGHGKLLGTSTNSPGHSVGGHGPWERQHSEDAVVIDQDQLSAQVAAPDWQQQVAHWTAVQQAQLGRDQQKLQKKSHELEDMLEKISAAYGSEQSSASERSYLDYQQPANDHVTPQMRMIVCSWLSEVATEFNMQQETLFLSVALLDRFMGDSNGVPRSALQLVAVACMLVAAKHEEVTHPNVEEFTDIAANCFQVEDLRRMERLLIDHLNWQITTPTVYSFLHLYTQATAMVRDIATMQHVAHSQAQSTFGVAVSGICQAMPKSLEPMSGHLVAKAAFLSELSILDYRSLAFKPSQVAAAALLLAQSWSEQGAAPQEIHQISGYSSSDLHECMGRLLQLHQCATDCDSSEMLAPFKHIREKYAQDCWLHTSLHELPAAAVEVVAPAPATAVAGGHHANWGQGQDMCVAPSLSGFCT